jgi:signal transduction histidine kinase/ABC-type uncharacterized transport system substrate-binding protein
MMQHRLRISVSALLLLFGMFGVANAEPKRVLILNSFGRDFEPWAEFRKNLRAELDRKTPEPIEFHDASLEIDRFGAGQDEGPFVNYLQALYGPRGLDLVVAIGGPAARFVQQHRQKIFPTAPMVLAGVEQRRVSVTALGKNDTVVATANDFEAVVQNILDLLPETTNISVVIGDSPNERFWLEQIQTAFQPYTNRVAFTWFNDLSFDEMLKRVAALPPKSAIFFGILSTDAAGISQEQGKSFARLHAAANAPIFSFIDDNFGRGLVGGPAISIADAARQTASVILRILQGEVPGSIKTRPIGPGTPKFDWRELQRWNISESRLPPDSEVHFRAPSIWEEYRLQMSVGLAVVILQSGLIFWLLIEHRRRHLAEIEASERRREVIHLNRTTTATVLSSSIAHELNQPLGAILSNAETAEILLKTVPPDLGQIGEILADIRKADLRAAEIIQQLRSLLRKRDEVDPQISDLNNTVREVVSIAAPEAAKRGVKLTTMQTPEALPIRAGNIHLQQVILNLVMNGIDALQGCDPGTRIVTIQTARSGKSEAEVMVSDSGKGIPEDQLKDIFEAFFTTKPEGTGLGLPISRTIIESYGGTLRAENRIGGGAMFSFRLALA